MAQMFVGGKQQAQAAGDVRKETGRLNNNGMDREAVDKNPVDNEHDFAALRANLGKKKASPKPTDEAKLQRAREKTGLEPGAQSYSSNQMHVAGAAGGAAPVVTESANDEEDFAALRANLGKNKAGASKKVKPAETVSIKPEPTVKEEEKDTDFAALRANLGKKKASPAGQMYVGGKQEAKPVDMKSETSRLNNNGMDRDRTDKNPVNDEHDFASLRANLGNKKQSKPDEVKIANARAKFEAKEEPVPEAQTKVFVGKKKPAESVSVNQQVSRLNNNGMERDRTDSNPVNDEFDFGSLRANLKRTS